MENIESIDEVKDLYLEDLYSEEETEIVEEELDPEEASSVEDVEEQEPVQVEFTLSQETVAFDTPLNDLGFASVSICICLFLVFFTLGWRSDK